MANKYDLYDYDTLLGTVERFKHEIIISGPHAAELRMMLDHISPDVNEAWDKLPEYFSRGVMRMVPAGRPSDYGKYEVSVVKASDYAQVKRDLDLLEEWALEELRDVLQEQRNAVVAKIKRGFKSADITMPKRNDLHAAVVVLLERALSQGQKDSHKELREKAKGYAEEFAGKAPREAMKWLREKALYVSGVLSARMLDQAKNILINALKTGEPLAATVDKLFNVWEPYLGNEAVIVDEQPLSPWRLENIVRTNTTEAYNQGRLASFTSEKAQSYIVGLRYSAILDERTTEVCRFLDNRVFRVTDPDIYQLTPPNHFQCRSIWTPIVIGMTVEEKDFITEAQKGRAKGLADVRFLTQQYLPEKGEEPQSKDKTVKVVRGENPGEFKIIKE